MVKVKLMKSKTSKSYLRVLLNWIRVTIDWWCAEIPTFDHGIGSTETKLGNERNCFVTYEINVSKNGKHVFATDSCIRSYTEEDIVKLINLFRTAFPDCKITVNPFGKSTPALPDGIKQALNQVIGF